eukprot:jgi/Psemu1/284716/fgenesh1_pg.62_\
MIQSRKRRAVYRLNDPLQAEMGDNSRGGVAVPSNINNDNTNTCTGNHPVASGVLPPSVRSRSERSNLQRNNRTIGNGQQMQQQQQQHHQQRHKYFCHQCNVGFQRQKSLREHLDGRKHKRVLAEWESAAKEYASQVPTWRYTVQPTVVPVCVTVSKPGNPLERQYENEQQPKPNNDGDGRDPMTAASSDSTAAGDEIPAHPQDSAEPQPKIDTNVDVRSSWSATEFEDFPHRSSCIDPSLLISTLSPQLRARFWRYLRDTFGDHYPELSAIFHHVSVRHPQYMRVKELLENLEAFKIVGKIVLLSEQRQRQPPPPRSSNGNSNGNGNGNARSYASKGHDKTDSSNQQKTIDVIYDLACGHGLLGILLAYRFATKRVVCVDLEERKSFFAFREAFVAEGEACPDHPDILSNLEYRVADLRSVASEVTPTSCLVAIHACNEANKHVVDMAKAVKGATWAVMPCCIRSKLYLGGAPVRDVDSQVRYQLLCGAFAEANRASVIRSVPRDVTARPVLIAGGFPLELTGGGGGDAGEDRGDEEHHPA